MRRTGCCRSSAPKCPGGEAVSRSITRPACKPRFCKSLFTSRSCGTVCSFCWTIGAQRRRSCRLSPCSVYWNCALPNAPADLDLLHGLQKERCTRNASQLRPEAVRHLKRTDLAHVQRLQRDINVGNVGSRDEAAHDVDRRIGPHNRDIVVEFPAHGRKRHVLRGARVAVDSTGVLLREETLGNHDVKIDRQPHRSQAACRTPKAGAAGPSAGSLRTPPEAT